MRNAHYKLTPPIPPLTALQSIPARTDRSLIHDRLPAAAAPAKRRIINTMFAPPPPPSESIYPAQPRFPDAVSAEALGYRNERPRPVRLAGAASARGAANCVRHPGPLSPRPTGDRTRGRPTLIDSGPGPAAP